MSKESAEKVQNPPILISVFNHKGGVGKTTSTYNIGYILSLMGLRVLLVDADPQASLTTVIKPKLSLDPKAHEKFKADLKEEAVEGRYSAIDDIFSPSIYGSGAAGIGGGDTIHTGLDRARSVKLMSVHKYPNLFFIPGSIRFERISEQITLGIANVPGTRVYANMVPNVIREVGRLNDIDIVLFDLNPSINGLNQSIFMNSDYVIYPFKPELGCLDAARNLCEEIPRWFNRFRVNNLIGAESGPIMLGAFPQLMRTRRAKVKGNPDAPPREQIEIAYQDWINRIFTQSEELFKEHQKCVPAQTQVLFTSSAKNRPGIRDMIAAGLHVQRSGRPISDLKFQHRSIDGEGATIAFSKKHKEKKQQINVGYKRVVGVLFQSMTAAHLRNLEAKIPGFRESLTLFSNLDEELERELNTQIPSQKSGKKSSKKKRVAEDHHWYDNDEVTNLLRHYCANDDNIFVTTPMQGDGHFSDEQLQENMEGFMFERIADDPAEREGITKLLIPLNVGAVRGVAESGNHWVLLFIRYSQNLEQIFFFDPLGRDLSERTRDAIMGAVNAVFHTRVERIERFESQVQTDGYNCGPWIVEAARLLAGNEGGDLTRLANMNIDDQRREHMEALNPRPASRSRKAKHSTKEALKEALILEADMDQQHQSQPKGAAAKPSNSPHATLFKPAQAAAAVPGPSASAKPKLRLKLPLGPPPKQTLRKPGNP